MGKLSLREMNSPDPSHLTSRSTDLGFGLGRSDSKVPICFLNPIPMTPGAQPGLGRIRLQTQTGVWEVWEVLSADTVPLTGTVYSLIKAVEVKSEKLAVGGQGSPLRVSPSVLGSLPDALFSMSQGQAPG